MKTLFLSLLFIGAFAGCSPENSASASPSPEKTPLKAEKSTAKGPTAETLKDGVVAYYFHGNRRCSTCMGIQDTIVNTIDTRFLAETTAGKLVFKEINIEEDANKHFVPEYQLSFSTLVVEGRKNGKAIKWENCGKVWDLAHEQPALAQYVEERINTFLQLTAQ